MEPCKHLNAPMDAFIIAGLIPGGAPGMAAMRASSSSDMDCIISAACFTMSGLFRSMSAACLACAAVGGPPDGPTPGGTPGTPMSAAMAAMRCCVSGGILSHARVMRRCTGCVRTLPSSPVPLPRGLAAAASCPWPASSSMRCRPPLQVPAPPPLPPPVQRADTRAM